MNSFIKLVKDKPFYATSDLVDVEKWTDVFIGFVLK